MTTDSNRTAGTGDRDLDNRAVAARLEALILGVDGVERLQPTLRRAVASATADAVRRAPAMAGLVRPGTPGLDVRPARDGSVDVIIDLSVRPGATALTVGRDVRRVVGDDLLAAGQRPGRIIITVLDVVPDEPVEGVTRQ